LYAEDAKPVTTETAKPAEEEKPTGDFSVSSLSQLSQDARYEMKGQGMKGTATNSERDSSFLYGGVTIQL
jgi:hypothetical protein